MFDLFKRNKEPLHVTRQTVFDSESIPAAALDGDLERRIAALEISSRAIKPYVDDLVDIHKEELVVYYANEVAEKKCEEAKAASRLATGTINAKEVNVKNVGEQPLKLDAEMLGITGAKISEAFCRVGVKGSDYSSNRSKDNNIRVNVEVDTRQLVDALSRLKKELNELQSMLSGDDRA